MTEHKTHIGHSLENDTWFVRIYGFETEADAKAYQASIASPAPHVVGSEVSEIERLTAERDELQKALDSAEIKAGITSNGNLWRFWSWRAKELAVKYTKLASERDRFRSALASISETEPSGHLEFRSPKHSGYAALEIARAALASAEVEG